MAASKAKILSMVGFWAFIVGLVIAVIAGILGIKSDVILIILIILGLIIGFLNITASEIKLFLIATIALIVAGGAFDAIKAAGIGGMISNILSLVAALMAPAAIVAAIKALWAVGKPGS